VTREAHRLPPPPAAVASTPGPVAVAEASCSTFTGMPVPLPNPLLLFANASRKCHTVLSLACLGPSVRRFEDATNLSTVTVLVGDALRRSRYE